MLKILIFLTLACSAGATAQTATSLSPAQARELARVKAAADTLSAPYALKLAATVKRIYANMLSPREDQRLRRTLAAQLHQYTAKLLDIRGQYYRDALKVLTPDQLRTVRKEFERPDTADDLGKVIDKIFKINGS